MRISIRGILAMIALTLCGAFATPAQAGTMGKTIFMSDVSVGSWTAISNLTIDTTSGGTYTNATTNTITCRISGTNKTGRLPVSTNAAISFLGGTNGTNAVTLTWPRYDGVRNYVIEKSYDAGATWTNWLTLGPSVTNWTDTGTNSWTDSVFTNAYTTLMPAPTVPWSPSQDVAEIEANLGTVSARVDVVETGTVDRAGSRPFGTNLVEVGNGMKFGAGGSNGADMIWIGPTGDVHTVGDNADIVTAQAAADAAQSTANTANSLADSAYDWSDLNERRIASLWAGTYGSTHDLPGGFWVSCTNESDFDLTWSSNYTISASGAAWAGPINRSVTKTVLQNRWRLMDNLGTTAILDAQADQNLTATKNTSAMSTNGPFGNANSAIRFTRADGDYVNHASWYPVVGAAHWSFSIWLYQVSKGPGNTFITFTGRNGFVAGAIITLIEADTNGTMQLNFDGGWNLNTAVGALPLNEWHHFGGTYDGTTARFYADGLLTNSGPYALNIVNTTHGTALGANGAYLGSTDYSFDGAAAEYQWFTNVLSDADMLSLKEDRTLSGGNMLLRTTNALWATETYTQTQGRVVLYVNDPDNDTRINTDLVARASADGGTNWETIVLRPENVWPSDTMIYSFPTNWTVPGTQQVVEVYVETTNDCDGALTGAGIFSQE
ncbi:MAG: hypothetical protein HQ559_07325 [Lentisphaerae bacterium]|nr:hypothetical protein [Lentisphaerota bacterium]